MQSPNMPVELENHMRIRLKHIAHIVALLVFAGTLLVNDATSARELKMREARRAITLGKALPPREILRRVRADIPGEILRVALISRGGRLFYRFKILRAGGRVLRVFVDARTAEIRDVK